MIYRRIYSILFLSYISLLPVKTTYDARICSNGVEMRPFHELHMNIWYGNIAGLLKFEGNSDELKLYTDLFNHHLINPDVINSMF